MKFWIFLVALLSGEVVSAQAGRAEGPNELSAQRLWVRVSAGEGMQDFRWSIAGNSAGQDPNIYSELKWHGVVGPVGRIALEWRPIGRWRVMVSGSRVVTRAGTMTDTDYGLDNRYDPIYHQAFAAHEGYSEAGAMGVGYAFHGSRWEMKPYAGFGINKQYFPVTAPAGPYEGLNSWYAAKWTGPFVKADGCWQLPGRWQVVADLAYHQVRYHATADWNLIPEFAHPVSFRHTADGYGIEAEGGMRYRACSRIAVELRGGYYDWETGTGIDQLYLSTGGSDETQLNGAFRHGWTAELGVAVGLF